MDAVVKWIASNTYLQATGIMITLVGAVIFLWTNRRVIVETVGWIVNQTFGRIWTPEEHKQRHVKIGMKHPSYLVAVIARTLAFLIFIIVLRWSGGVTLEAASKIQPSTTLSQIFLFSLHMANSTFNLIIGARLGELYRICSDVMAAIEGGEPK